MDASNPDTRILVYGAGPLGSLFAARLQQGGNDVSLLARGQRLADLREHGVVVKDVLASACSSVSPTLPAIARAT